MFLSVQDNEFHFHNVVDHKTKPTKFQYSVITKKIILCYMLWLKDHLCACWKQTAFQQFNKIHPKNTNILIITINLSDLSSGSQHHISPEMCISPSQDTFKYCGFWDNLYIYILTYGSTNI